MNQEIKLPEPDTHCWDDDFHPPRDVWSYSADLVRQIIEADRAQRGEPAFGLMTPETQDREASLQDTAPQPSQPAHTEAEVQEILDSSLREWGVFEQTVRIILNVEKP
jgi:hypothetical protein